MGSEGGVVVWIKLWHCSADWISGLIVALCCRCQYWFRIFERRLGLLLLPLLCLPRAVLIR